MAKTRHKTKRGKSAPRKGSHFPYAPPGWTQTFAREQAKEEGLELTDDHWQALHALQEYFARNQDTRLNVRELRDALDEKFYRQGGTRYLYQLFPGGPVAQGCRIAGLKAPTGSSDPGFGSVV
jgi:tRNA 2-thiouridine synthesizing protein E